MLSRRLLHRHTHRRSGLAPLELVLNLPIMLMVMCLMIIIGTAGAWKVRTLANSRQAAWRALEHRTGQNDPHPRGWPEEAEMELRNIGPPVLEGDPWQEHEVVRGPQLVAQGGSLPVNTDLLDSSFGLRSGFAEIDREYPIWKKLPGRNHFPRDHVLLDGTRFQYTSMGLGSNTRRRIPRIYLMDLQAHAPNETARYVNAAMAIIYNPNIPDLLPLTGGDPEVYELIGERSPDFQPKLFISWRTTRIPAVRSRVPNYYTLDVARLRRERIDDPDTGLKRQIRDVPRRMSDYYIGVYQQVINYYQSLQPQPPEAAGIIAEMQEKIEHIERFRQSLPRE
ncbi:MAG: hypothetical protein ACREJB_10135 [Planctomycetaceae bacterium]